MALYNPADIIGILIEAFTNNITGALFGTMLVITILFLFIGLLFKLPMEFSLVINFPLFIVFASYESNYFKIIGVALMLLAIYFGKHFFIRD